MEFVENRKVEKEQIKAIFKDMLKYSPSKLYAARTIGGFPSRPFGLGCEALPAFLLIAMSPLSSNFMTPQPVENGISSIKFFKLICSGMLF